MTDSLRSFFTIMESQRGIVVQGTPKLDLDLYIQNYRGRTRFDRLFLIGRTSQTLCVDALKAAVAEAKRGRDVRRYQAAVESLHMAAPSEPEAVFDQQWIDHTEMSNRADTHRLEAELKGYKNNLIKESIRMGNEDLGKHYESIGDLNKAMDAYTRMRPDISTPKHIVDVGKHLVRVSLQRREWAMAAINVNKMAGNLSADDEKALQPYLKVLHGIALLGQGKYHEAALSFLQTDPAIPNTSYDEVASPNDVAIYGALLALASMDRKDLQLKVLDNAKFRAFLELEPHIRRAVTQFVNGRYSACLAILESYRADYLLDVYLQSHVEKIYEEIRSKCIVQYLIPFSCVTLESMNEAFAAPGQSIEMELVDMIRSGTLQARYNAIDKLVTTVSADARLALQLKALATAKSYQREAVESIRRMSLVAADLEVKGQRKFPGGQINLGQANDGQLVGASIP
ncbi:26S proteasome subunit RPN7-domain-containing protein [Phialemonium atrogriseum]|uniref:COP9 signalosome complex subunit 1 n=1 Tax=Phialemonium atrogriseum TaxID=1093897 RepID=A0AAJ0C241_9PEZI|nr:26S proteasome subunit RPN7-domain-containing protein [Phialemonium atrogriseum]KAK1768481.1 26S proteasome subunit RPN7-domain-containing protein [Phialemonium atrogriseum]